jgi:hypothetical protein
MSSGLLVGGGLCGLCVCGHGAVYDVAEASFVGSDGLAFGVTGCETAGYELLGGGVDPDLGDGDAVESGVALAVSSSVEADPFVV